MGFLFAGVLLFATLVIALRSSQKHSDPLAHLANWALTLLPATLLWAVFQSTVPRITNGAETETPWRITLSAFRFHLNANESLLIGGDAPTNHLAIAFMPERILSLQSAGAAAPRSLHAEAWDVNGGGVVVLNKNDSEAWPRWNTSVEPLLGGVEIPDGATLCLAAASSKCARGSAMVKVALTKSGAVLQGPGGLHRCSFAPPQKRRENAQSRVIFPLSRYARQDCRGSDLFAWSPSIPATEFFYWGPNARKLYLRPADPQALLIILPDGKTLEVGGGMDLTLTPGQVIKVHLWQILLAESLPGASSQDGENRAQERRSFKLRYDREPNQTGIQAGVFLDSPQTVGVPLAPREGLAVSSQDASPINIPVGYKTASFTLIGAQTARELLNFVQRPYKEARGNPGCATRDRALIVRSMSTITCAPIGRWFALGDPERFQVRLRMVPIEVPIAWLAALSALVLVNLLVREALRLPLLTRIVLAFLEMLLVLRLAIAFEAAAFDPRQEPTVVPAWMALLWLPLAFELTARSAASFVTATIARMSKVLFAILSTVLIAETVGMSWLDNSWKTLAIAAAVAGTVLWLPRIHALVSKFFAAPVADRGALIRAAVPIGLVMAVHCALLLIFGTKEQILGGRVTALIIPMLVLAWAHLFDAIRREQCVTWLSLAVACGALLFPWCIFVAVHDIGATLYFLAPIVWLAGDTRSRTSTARWVWPIAAAFVVALVISALGFYAEPFAGLRIPGLIALVPLAVLLIAQVWRSPPPLAVLWRLPLLAAIATLCALQLASTLNAKLTPASAADAGVTIDRLEHLQRMTSNVIRLMHRIAPDQVEKLGIRDGYEQRAAMAEMLSYSATTYGRGWLPAKEHPDALNQTHVNDTVPAVHVLSTFGRVGGCALALFLLAFGAAALIHTSDRSTPSAFAAQIAAITLVVVSLYMMLANIGVVPFTGRNFYFLSVASCADLLEGGLLLAFIAARRS
jgi:hypothetical protein